MPQTKDVGPLYGHTMRYPAEAKMGLLGRSWSDEVEEPYRRGRGIWLRLPFTRLVVVLGWWGRARDEEESLTSALGKPYEATEDARDWRRPVDEEDDGWDC